jgi:membrane protein
MIADLLKFIKHDIWRLDISKLPRQKSFLIKQLRVFLLAVKGFDEDNCLLRASSLTFYSLLSIVPVIALAFGISKGFGLEEALNNQLNTYLAAHPDILETVMEFSSSMLDNTKGGLLAGVGFVFLVWSVVKVLGHIETTFNAIWGITKGRSWIRKFTEYLAVMLLAPILVILSGSFTVLVAGFASETIEGIGWLSFMDGWIDGMMRLTPYVVIWFLFTFLYIAMPNTKVRFGTALVAGIIAGTMYQLLEIFYINFQVGAVKYNAIYGSFAVLPLFLIWMQASWMIVLFGAELSFANQNVDRYIFEAETKNISIRHKQKITLLVLHAIVNHFKTGEKPLSVYDLCKKHKIPIRLANEVIQDLLLAELIVKLEHEGKQDLSYMPSRDISDYKLYKIKKILELTGSKDIPVYESKEWETIETLFADFDRVCEEHTNNVNLSEISVEERSKKL